MPRRMEDEPGGGWGPMESGGGGAMAKRAVSRSVRHKGSFSLA